jgi:hypothetical protein
MRIAAYIVTALLTALLLWSETAALLVGIIYLGIILSWALIKLIEGRQRA